jgi:hypothetical protein
MKRFLIAFCVASLPARLLAQEPVGCDKFKWPLETERTALTRNDIRKVAPGDPIGRINGQAVDLSLVPLADAKLPMPPERTPKTGTAYAGFVRVDAPDKPGTYRVSLAGESWIDVVQDGRYVKSGPFSGALGCSGIRKSVKFALTAAPFVVQFTSGNASSLKMIITADQ